MKVQGDNKTYIIRKGPSVYTSRNNSISKLEDVSIFESGHNHGVRFNEENGLFDRIAIYASENGSVIRSGLLPVEINLDLLKQWGFINNIN